MIKKAPGGNGDNSSPHSKRFRILLLQCGGQYSTISNRVIGLVVKFSVAIGEPWVRFPDYALQGASQRNYLFSLESSFWSVVIFRGVEPISCRLYGKEATVAPTCFT